MNHYWGAILLCIIAMVLAMCSCAQKVNGGKSEHDTRAFSLVADANSGTVTVTDSRERAATSQPSSTTYGTTPEFTGSGGDFGEIGGFKFSQMRAQPIGSWILGGICILAAAAIFYFTRNVIVAAVVGAIGIAAFLLPTVLGIVAVGVVVVVIVLHFGGSLKRIIGSVTYGMDKTLDDPAKASFKDALEQKQNEADKAAVKALRPAA